LKAESEFATRAFNERLDAVAVRHSPLPFSLG
jgi:hypothetical protein